MRGYHPTKQGGPSHVYQTYWIAAIGMVLDGEVQAGHQRHPFTPSRDGGLGWNRRPREPWPKRMRGDIAGGTEGMLAEGEKRSLP